MSIKVLQQATRSLLSHLHGSRSAQPLAGAMAFVGLFLACLLTPAAATAAAPTAATATAAPVALAAAPTITVIADDYGDLPELTDGSQYYTVTARIHFLCARTEFVPSYLDNAEQIEYLQRQMGAIATQKIISVDVFGSASPDGSLKMNTQLAIDRAARLKGYMVDHYPDLFVDTLEWNTTYQYEDWSAMETLLEQSNIQHRDEALAIIRNTPYEAYDSKGQVVSARKQELKQLYGGAVWKEMAEKVFPYCRVAELQIVVKAPAMMLTTKLAEPGRAIAATPLPGSLAPLCPLAVIEPAPEAEPAPAPAPRQPMVAAKTNLLFYGTYMPKCGFRPVPNVSLEFLPRDGHWTGVATLDIPWYRNYSNHQFLQIRNWQLEARRYFRGGAQYNGWFASAYVHTGVYGIGLNKQQGWEGEFGGAGLGGGYVLPLSRDNHWKLEFDIQAGYIRTQYDPYVFGTPINGEENGLYYYNWIYDPDLFKERQYRYSWLGPTRVGITLSYDILYYPRHKAANKTK